MSALGKVYNIILNKRLDQYLLNNKIINPEQTGFCKKSRTSDHMMVLKTLIDKYTKKEKKKLFTCFVDFRKAFDSVLHPALLLKLKQLNINGSFFSNIKELYNDINLCVKYDNKLSTNFLSQRGVRQGDVLSPNMFKIFINDLMSYFNSDCKPVLLNDMMLYCLMYADDLVLLSETEEGLQNSLDNLSKFCSDWGLEININKTKVMIFNKSGKLLDKKYTFHVGSIQLEIAGNYRYLGIIFQSSGCFSLAKDDLYKRGLKAFFKMCRSFGSVYPNVKTLLHIFDHTVLPVLMYGSEIWGEFNPTSSKLRNKSDFKLASAYEGNHVDKMHIKFCKYILQVSKKATNIAILGELGRYPLYITIIKNIISFWKRFHSNSLDKDSLAYNAMLENIRLHDSGLNSWFTCIKFILCETGLVDTVNQPNSISKIILLKKIFNFLKNRHELRWREELFDDLRVNGQGNKLRTYRLFKNVYKLENYLLEIKNSHHRKMLTKFRISSHDLEIERGRYKHKKPEDRICSQCSNNVVEDELHFLIACPKYSHLREVLFKDISTLYKNFDSLNNMNKFIWLLSNEDQYILTELSSFISTSFELRK